MAINNKKYLLLVIIFFVFTSFLSAQTSGYFIEEKGDEVKYVQRFVWKGGEHTLYYEVVFEREINGAYIPYLKETTKAKFIEVSLPPGPYRFRVIPYDLLGRPTEGSPWSNIHVFAVTKPNQFREPEPEAEAKTKTTLRPKSELEPETEKAEEEEPENTEKEKTVFFRIGLDIGIGGRLSLYGAEHFGEISDGGLGLRTSIVFKAPLDLYIGPEFTVDANRWGNIENWRLFFYTVGLNILVEKWSPNKIFGVSFKFGLLYPTIDVQRNWSEASKERNDVFHGDEMSVFVSEENIYANRLIPSMGASIYFLIKKHLLLELGFNYIHMFSTISDYPASGFFCPKLGISYQF